MFTRGHDLHKFFHFVLLPQNIILFRPMKSGNPEDFVQQSISAFLGLIFYGTSGVEDCLVKEIVVSNPTISTV